MKMYYLESRSRGISYMKYVNERQTGLVTFYEETAFYSGLLKERYKEDRSDRNIYTYIYILLTAPCQNNFSHDHIG
jgi:hypothetical protein